MLDKLVKARKVSIREDIAMDAAKALQVHIDRINEIAGRKGAHAGCASGLRRRH